MDIKSTKSLQPLSPYKKSLYGHLHLMESSAKTRLFLLKQFEILSGKAVCGKYAVCGKAKNTIYKYMTKA
jgi:hypothetical protein